MDAMLGLYWAKRLTDLFLEDIIVAKRTPPGSIDVRPWGDEILIHFRRLGSDDTAEKYRISREGSTIWVPGDSWFPHVYHPKDHDGHCRQGKDLRGRVATMLMANDFRLKRENVKSHPEDELDIDYFSEYVRKV